MSQYIDFCENRFWYDSRIDPPRVVNDQAPFEYSLILRVYLDQVSPPPGKRTATIPDHNGRPVAIQRWDGAAWSHFKTKYVERVLEVWDEAFILIPPAAYSGFVWPDRGKRRNLLCKLTLKLVDSPGSAHASVRIVRLANPTADSFRSDAELYSSNLVDLKRQNFWPARASFLQNAAAHEVGHLLMLWHSNEGDPKCDPSVENSICYGSNLIQRMNVMGAGGMLALSNALPWCKRIEKHVPSTHKSEWKVGWASIDAQVRGIAGYQDLDDFGNVKKPTPPKPGLIDYP
jgi:hypothetical protein